MMDPADLDDEQRHLERAHEELARMRSRAEHLLTTMKGADPDLEWALLRRVRALVDSPRALCFGRIDHEDGPSWHVGRRHVEDEMGDPVVVEWRAPVALPFYRASWAEPLGLVRRRQFVVDDRRLLSIGDDTFGGDDPGRDRDMSLRGGEALLVELERARSGEMIDIVATIQPEQDRVIRAPAPGILAVQGGPGSGKTAVGLHRAAYLLYGDDAMARAGVLVVGPNRTFLRYIAQVLPTLGEHSVVQSTLVDLVPEVSAQSGKGAADAQRRRAASSSRRGVDQAAGRGRTPVLPPEADAAVERLKGDGRMAEVLARAVADRRHGDTADVVVLDGLRRLVVPSPDVDAAWSKAAGARVPYAAGRDLFRDLLVILVARRYEAVAGLPADGEELDRRLRRSDGVRDGLDRRWPTVAPATLVAELLGKPAVLAAAADGVLDDGEQRSLRRARARAWTSADVPLVDEARHLISGQTRAYAHVIVDEAQDLSPMQLRMLARRCPSGSMTLLGDLAQAVGVWGLADWKDVAAWLPAPEGVDVVELRFGYRSPAQVLDLAGRLLPAAAPDVTPTQAVRPGRHAPRRQVVPAAALSGAIVSEVAALSAAWGSVGVLAPSSMVDELCAALSESGALDVGEASSDGLGHRVTVVSAEGAKGLEFDAVAVVEPEGIVAERAERAAGLRLLYVALTRPTQHLSILATAEVPELADAA
jgi:DNA helicase IV